MDESNNQFARVCQFICRLIGNRLKVGLSGHRALASVLVQIETQTL